MAVSQAPKQRAPHRRWPLSGKRRIVELTLRAGASTRAIAREQGVSPSSLYHWKALYRTGRLDARPVPGVRTCATSATFLPVSITPAEPTRRIDPASDASARGSGVVQFVFASGATMRIETGTLDAALLCALIAALQH